VARSAPVVVTQLDERGAPWSRDPWDDPDQTNASVLELPPRARRPVQAIVIALGLLLTVSLLVAGGVGWWYLRQVNPSGDPGPAANFTVNQGETIDSLSVRLQDQGFITNARVFRWYVDHHGGLELVPGYYTLRPRDHLGNLMRVLRTPPSLTYTKVTFPEGFTIEKMDARLSATVPRLPALALKRAATDGSIRSAWSPDGVTSLEGLLFPDTYQVSNDESAGQVVERMVALMERVGGQEDLEEGAAALGLTPYQVLTVASIVEREGKFDDDRARIARVIYNRLAAGMALQVDATLFYGQPTNVTFDQVRDLDTPYNTYLHEGLPPTPIANPGRASIRAALHPAPNPSVGDPLCANLPAGTPCEYRYYVKSDEEGHHAFAVTLAQHEANVAAARAAGLL
jgi:UPF0755 protein